ncbi:hypothetical protein V8C42DRAFT_310260 [Trichoderma barbatum]
MKRPPIAAITRLQMQTPSQVPLLHGKPWRPMAFSNGLNWHRIHNGTDLGGGPRPHPPSREDLRAPCSLDYLRPLLSGSDSKKLRRGNPEALEPMSGGVFPLRDADLEDPVSSPPGRFRWPGSQRLALAFCGSVD